MGVEYIAIDLLCIQCLIFAPSLPCHLLSLCLLLVRFFSRRSVGCRHPVHPLTRALLQVHTNPTSLSLISVTLALRGAPSLQPGSLAQVITHCTVLGTATCTFVSISPPELRRKFHARFQDDRPYELMCGA